jgi:hypothetical protein
MLKANVGVSRKISKDYNSTGFSLNLEGEILAPVDDPEAVVQRIRELYGIAEEALDRQINDSQGTDEIARRDKDDPGENDRNGHGNARPEPRPDRQVPGRNGDNGKPRSEEPATNKQVQYLQTLAKRNKLFGPRLETFIEEVVGHRCSAYDLSKPEAGRVIDQLAGDEAGSQSRR